MPPFAYKLAVRKTPKAWFFLAYDMSQASRGEAQFQRAIWASVFIVVLSFALVFALRRIDPRVRGLRHL